jgi:hypothetical protein
LSNLYQIQYFLKFQLLGFIKKMVSNCAGGYEQRVIEVTLAMFDEFQERDSNWTLTRIQNLMLNINKLNPMHAGCCIELPREVSNHCAVINVQAGGKRWRRAAGEEDEDNEAEDR